MNWWIDGIPTEAYDEATAREGELLLGEIHVIADDTIEYRLDDQLIATYRPRDVPFPGCD